MVQQAFPRLHRLWSITDVSLGLTFSISLIEDQSSQRHMYSAAMNILRLHLPAQSRIPRAQPQFAERSKFPCGIARKSHSLYSGWLINHKRGFPIFESRTILFDMRLPPTFQNTQSVEMLSMPGLMPRVAGRPYYKQGTFVAFELYPPSSSPLQRQHGRVFAVALLSSSDRCRGRAPAQEQSWSCASWPTKTTTDWEHSSREAAMGGATSVVVEIR